MYDANDKMLAKWAKSVPIKSGFGFLVPVCMAWEWGQLVLMPNQKDGGRYYVYRRESVQGKFCVVKLGGLAEVLCTAQTLKGAFCVCEELNTLVKCNATEGDD